MPIASDAKIFLVASTTTVTFAVLVALALVVFDGRPFVSSAGAGAGTHALAFVALLTSVYMLTRAETFVPSMGPAILPVELLRGAPFLTKPKGVETVRVKAYLGGAADGAQVLYWDELSRVAGAAVADGRTVLMELPTGTRRAYYRVVRPSGLLGAVGTLDVGAKSR